MTQTREEAGTHNGIKVEELYGTLDALKREPTLAKFTFRAQNRWLKGAHNRSSIRGFYGAGEEDASRDAAFTMDAGEPPLMLGSNEGPNPAEYLLHALAACLTTSLVYVAAARGIDLEEVESTLEGDIDLLGSLGLDSDTDNGYEGIRVTFRVKSDAPCEKIEAILERAHGRSPVFDTITRGVPVVVTLAD